MIGQQCVDQVLRQIATDVVSAAEAENAGDDHAVVNEMLAGVKNVILVSVKLRKSHSMKVVLLLLLLQVSNTIIFFFSARCNICISHLYYVVSVRLSVDRSELAHYS